MPGPEVLAVLGAARGPAEESTFRRAFALVSADVLDRVLGAWLHTRAMQAGGRLVIAIDGKTVRGAKSKGGKAPHLVAALAHGIGAVLGQVAVEEKSNEIPAVRDLLKAFASLASAVITIDAMHTQTDTAQVILGRGADYVMTVKGNMPTLYRQLKKLPWAAVPAVSDVSTDHGRLARRTIKVALAPAWIEFDGAAQVAQLRRTVTKEGKKTVEVVYLITSDCDAGPAARVCQVNGSVALSVVAGCADVSRSVMIDVTSLVGTVFSGLSALVIDDVEDAGEAIVVRARTRGRAVACPGCGTETSRVHGYHERTAADAPVDGRRVLVKVRVRRMRCPALDCKVQTFREQVPGVLERYQRRIPRLTAQVSAVAREFSRQGLGAAAAGAGDRHLPAYRAAGPPQDPPARAGGAARAGDRPIRGPQPPVRNVASVGQDDRFLTSACRYPRSHTNVGDVGMMSGHGGAACPA